MKKLFLLLGLLTLGVLTLPRAYAAGVDFEFKDTCFDGNSFVVEAYFNSGNAQTPFNVSAAEFKWKAFPSATTLQDLEIMFGVVVDDGIPTGTAIIGEPGGYSALNVGEDGRTPFAELTFTASDSLSGTLGVEDVRIFGFDNLDDMANVRHTEDLDLSTLPECPEADEPDDVDPPVDDAPEQDVNNQPPVQQPPVDVPQEPIVDDTPTPTPVDTFVPAAVIDEPVVEEDEFRGAAPVVSAPEPVQFRGAALQETGPAENLLALVIGLAFSYALWRFRKFVFIRKR